MQPSSFASRRAQRQEQPRRLVSLGVTPVHLDGFGSKAKGQVVDMEYLYDVDHPSRRYRRMVPNGTIEPLFETRGEEPVEKLGTMPRLRDWRSGQWPETATDTVSPVA